MKNLFLLLLLLSNGMASAQNDSTRIFFNGIIFTGNPEQPVVEAIAVKGARITHVGKLNAVKKAAGTPSLAVDLHGAFMMPGMVDSHNHAISGGLSMLLADLGDTILSSSDLSSYALRVIANGKGLRGDALYIQGMNSGTWRNASALEHIFEQGDYKIRPVLLEGSDGHTAWANAAMMKRAGIDADFVKSLPVPEQSYFGMTNGMPNGLLSESAIHYATSTMPPGKISAAKGLRTAVAHLNSLGITSWLDPSVGSTSNGIENVDLQAYDSAQRNGSLTAHVTATLVADANSDPDPQIEIVRSWQKRSANSPVKIAGFKIFADGVMEFPTQTASMVQPYRNSGLTGSQMVDPNKLIAFVKAADRANMLVHIHAIGDKAVTESLDAFAAARKSNRNSTLPHSITHLQCVLPADFIRFKKLNVLASMQLLWATADNYTEDLVKPYIDPNAYKYMYPAQSIIKHGGTVCGASDWPVSSANPFEAMYVAETRKGALGVLNANEAVSRLDMLRAYTILAARAILREREVGSLEPGKYADLILLDRNAMTVSSEAVRDTKVLWTMVEGRVVYQR